MTFGEWRDRFLEPIKELYGRLTASQRLSLVVLGGVVSLALVVLVYTSPGQAMMTLPRSELTPEFKDFLETQGIDYRLNERGNVMIPAAARETMVAHAFEAGVDKQEPSYFDWIFQPANLQETAGRFSEKVKISERMRLQKTLAAFEGIESGTVIGRYDENSSLLVNANDRSTTAVQLHLEPGLSKLPNGKARVIGCFVARALNVSTSRVELTDQHGNRYNIDSELGLDSGDKRAREEAMLQKVERLVEAEFSRDEWRAVVSVNLDRSSAVERSVTVSDDNTAKVTRATYEEERSTPLPAGLSPGTAANVSVLGGTSEKSAGNGDQKYKRGETEYATEIGRTERRRRLPAGAEEGWSITVSLSEEAVRRKIVEKKEIYDGITDYRPTPADVQQFLETKRQELEGISSLGPEKVSARVTSFEPRPAFVATTETEVSIAGFLGDHFRELVLAVLAMVACFFVYRLTAGGLPEMEELPDPVVELQQFLEERERRERDAAVAGALELSEETEELSLDGWQISSDDKMAAQLLEVVGEFVEDHPLDTASMLKIWLAEQDSVVAGEGEGDS